MHHIFITRLAVVIPGKASRLETRLKKYSSIQERISDIIQYWSDHASKFYTLQTIDSPFKVFLIYSKRYEDVVKSFDYPDWVELCLDRRIDSIADRQIFEQYDNEPMSVSRIDADDWYSNDYFDMLEQSYVPTHKNLDMSIILNKNIIQFNRANNDVSYPIRYSSPGFASLVFNKFSKNYIPVNIRLWPHGSIKRMIHIEPTQLNCMQSVGINAVNKWRMNTPINYSPPVDRFYIPSSPLVV